MFKPLIYCFYIVSMVNFHFDNRRLMTGLTQFNKLFV